jgi:hypothetical protein
MLEFVSADAFSAFLNVIPIDLVPAGDRAGASVDLLRPSPPFVPPQV